MVTWFSSSLDLIEIFFCFSKLLFFFTVSPYKENLGKKSCPARSEARATNLVHVLKENPFSL